jgi:hypothetical protein
MFEISNYSIHGYGLLKIDRVLAIPFALSADHGTPIVGSKDSIVRFVMFDRNKTAHCDELTVNFVS